MKVCACSFPSMGLCNRLRSLLSAMRFAEKSGATLQLCWPVSPVVSCRFDELFTIRVEQADQPTGEARYFNWRLWVTPGELPAGWARAYPAQDVNGCAIDFEYERIPAALQQEYAALIAKLAPRAEIEQRAAKITDAPFVAVHVRDGSDWQAWGRATPLANFIAAMDRYPSETRFFVSAHTCATIDALQRRYPGRIISQPEKEYDEPTARRMQDTLVDLLCLARGTELIGTYGSTFSEMAWWLGGCSKRVTIVEGDRSRFKYL